MAELLSQALGYLFPFLPAMARIAAMVALAPGFSFQQVPARFRAMFALALAALIAPLSGKAAPRLLESPQAFMEAIFWEVVLGAIIGLVAALMVETARYAASFVELQAGLRAGEVFDPAQATPSSLLGRFYYLTAVVVFFCLNGHHILLALACESLRVMPPGAVQFAPTVGRLATGLLASSFWLAVAVALPTISALLLTDLAFGLVARLVSNFNVFFVGLPAKLAVTLVGMALSAPLLAVAMGQAVAIVARSLAGLGL